MFWHIGIENRRRMRRTSFPVRKTGNNKGNYHEIPIENTIRPITQPFYNIQTYKNTAIENTQYHHVFKHSKSFMVNLNQWPP